MKHNKLCEALNEISDRHIAEAAKSKRRPRWLAPTAAALALLILCLSVRDPLSLHVSAVSHASAPRITSMPKLEDFQDRDQYLSASDSWKAERDNRDASVAAARNALAPFFQEGSVQFLTGSGNTLWSPANAAIGLAMLAELTSGNSQAQLLGALGVEDLDTLRTNISALWESTYHKEGKEVCTLANSLWLEEGLSWEEEVMNTLAYYHYASIYEGDLGTATVDRAVGSWLNRNTGGLLESSADSIRLDPETVLALYSTLYLQSKWSDEFSASKNTQDTFHAPSGDRSVTFMNKNLEQMYYYWGDTYGAVVLGLKNGCRMWFLLPDEGLTPEDVLRDGQYMDMLLNSGYEEWEQSKYMKVNLSVPKFDISQSQDLKEGLRRLGITDIFSQETADFSAITSGTPVTITAANQSVRVQVDEQGVKAAAYIEFPGAGAAAPPEEIIDFVLDRPFVFLITNDRVPLITGVVNEP